MRKAFTLVEIMIVVIIIGVMSGLSLPVFTATIGKGRLRDAILNLNVIHASNVLYKSRNGSDLSAANLAAINTALHLNIIANGAAYQCSSGSCTATNGFTATLNLTQPLSTGNPLTDNPRCTLNCP